MSKKKRKIHVLNNSNENLNNVEESIEMNNKTNDMEINADIMEDMMTNNVDMTNEIAVANETVSTDETTVTNQTIIANDTTTNIVNETHNEVNDSINNNISSNFDEALNKDKEATANNLLSAMNISPISNVSQTENVTNSCSNNMKITSGNQTFKIINSNLTPAQIEEMLQKSGLANITVEALPSKKKTNYHMINDTTAECIHCHTQFDISNLDENIKALTSKTGLCPNCQAKYDEGSAIEASMKANNGRTVHNSKFTKSAFSIVMEMVNASTFNEDSLNKLSDKDWTRQYGLTYGLFKVIPENATDDDIKILRNDKNGKARFAKNILTFNNVKYLITNDIYHRNLDKIETMLKELNVLDESYTYEGAEKIN